MTKSVKLSWKKNCGREMEDKWGKLNSLVLPLACRKNLEQIRKSYGENEEELVNLLHKKDWGSHRNEICILVSLWLLDIHERDAIIAKNAFEHGDINYNVLIEIYCGRKSSHIVIIKRIYQAKFRRQLDQDIIYAEPPSAFQRILIALATSHKSHDTDVSRHIAKCDARRLYETGEGRPGAIEESVVLEIFSKRSIPQLKLTLTFYKHIYGRDFTKALKKEINGEFGDALRVVVKCLYTPSKYYAKILHTSIKGGTGDTSALVRVIMSRSDSEMDDIQRVFKKKYEYELKDAISECIQSLDCREFLVALTRNFSS